MPRCAAGHRAGHSVGLAVLKGRPKGKGTHKARDGLTLSVTGRTRLIWTVAIPAPPLDSGRSMYCAKTPTALVQPGQMGISSTRLILSPKISWETSFAAGSILNGTVEPMNE